LIDSKITNSAKSAFV